MKPIVNLASEPFRNRRLFWLAILVLFIVPSYFGLEAIGQMTLIEGEISNRRNIIRGLETQLRRYDRPVSGNVTITTDQNRELVAASELIARRVFSWSQLLNDIERNIPASVRVMRVAVNQIQPQERTETISGNISAATLMLDVIGKSGQDVTGMINRLHDSGRFKVQPLTKKPVEGTDEVEFTLMVEYFPPQAATGGSPNYQIAEKKQ